MRKKATICEYFGKKATIYGTFGKYNDNLRNFVEKKRQFAELCGNALFPSWVVSYAHCKVPVRGHTLVTPGERSEAWGMAYPKKVHLRRAVKRSGTAWRIDMHMMPPFDLYEVVWFWGGGPTPGFASLNLGLLMSRPLRGLSIEIHFIKKVN